MPCYARVLALPLAASLLVFCAGTSSATPDSSPATSSRTLITIEAAARPLAEIAGQIAAAGKLHVQVDPDVREWKATVVFKGDPEALLSHLCQEFRLQLVRSVGGDGAERFQLVLPQMERNRLRALYAARDQRRTEAQKQDQQRLVAAVDREFSLAQGAMPPKSAEGPGDREPYSDVLARFVHSLGTDALKKLASGPPAGDALFSDQSASLRIPAASLSGEQRGHLASVMDQALRGQPGDAAGPASARLAELQTSLNASSIKFWMAKRNGFQTLLMTVQVPGKPWHIDFSVAFAKASKPDETASQDPGQMDPEPDPREDAKISYDADNIDYSEALVLLARQGHLNLVAEALTLAPHLSLKRDSIRIWEVSSVVSRKWKARRTWVEGVMHWRLPDWELRLEEEPSAAVLDRVVSETERVEMALPLRLYVASHATRQQLIGLGNWHDKKRSLQGAASRIYNGYALYRWLGDIGEAALEKVANGLPIRSLSRKSQEALRLLAEEHLGSSPEAGIAAVRLRMDRIALPGSDVLELLNGEGALVGEIR